MGALIAKTSELRRLVSPENGKQLVFVYDDPTEKENMHALVRGLETVPREEQDEVRVLLKRAFRHKLCQSNGLKGDV